MKKRIVSGITATGTLTIGNYIGAIQNFLELQKKNDLFIFVADLHALTIDIKPEALKKNRKDIMALYLACGLNPEKTTLFFQSDILETGIFSWIMENRTTIGELYRMTQFKDKALKYSESKKGKIKTGLLTYPTLMVADILLYNPHFVPVGMDQKQHLELTRNVAERFNNEFYNYFNIPEPYINKIGAKIMSLVDPSKKMSKSSLNPKSYISLLEDPDLAYQKIIKAKTDSENLIYYSDQEHKRAISNLLTIYASLTNYSIAEISEMYKDQNYGNFKKNLAEIVKNFLIDLQQKYRIFLPKVDGIAFEGALKARKVASQTLNDVKKIIGLD